MALVSELMCHRGSANGRVLLAIAIYALIGFLSFFFIIVPITGGIVLNPLLSLIVDPHTAVSMSVFFFMVNSGIKAFFFRHDIVFTYFRDMLLISVVAAVVGTYAIGLVPEAGLLLVMLFMTLFFLRKKVVSMMSPPDAGQVKRSVAGNLLTGLTSGFMQGAGLGGGGSLRKSYFLANGLNMLQTHGTTSAISVVLGGVSTGVRLQTSQVTVPMLMPIVYLFPVMVVATILGRKTLLRLSRRVSDRIIVLTLAVTAALLLAKLGLELL